MMLQLLSLLQHCRYCNYSTIYMYMPYLLYHCCTSFLLHLLATVTCEKLITTITELVVVWRACNTCTCTVNLRFLWPQLLMQRFMLLPQMLQGVVKNLLYIQLISLVLNRKYNVITQRMHACTLQILHVVTRVENGAICNSSKKEMLTFVRKWNIPRISSCIGHRRWLEHLVEILTKQSPVYKTIKVPFKAV